MYGVWRHLEEYFGHGEQVVRMLNCWSTGKVHKVKRTGPSGGTAIRVPGLRPPQTQRSCRGADPFTSFQHVPPILSARGFFWVKCAKRSHEKVTNYKRHGRQNRRALLLLPTADSASDFCTPSFCDPFYLIFNHSSIRPSFTYVLPWIFSCLGTVIFKAKSLIAFEWKIPFFLEHFFACLNS